VIKCKLFLVKDSGWTIICKDIYVVSERKPGFFCQGQEKRF